MRRFGKLIAAIAWLLAAPAGSGIAHAAKVTVLAAASLTDVLATIDADFQKQSGNSVTAAFGGSNALAKQLENGAPGDVFISADGAWMDYVQKAKVIDAASRSDLLGNGLVLVAPQDSTETVAIDSSTDFAALLKGGRLAVADASAVPAGKYAKAALTKLGQWDKVQGSLAQAENVRAALLLVERGEAPYGIVYATDAAVAKVKVVGTFPEDSHPKIIYPVALTVKGAQSQAARDYLAFLRSDAAKAAFTKAGFIVLP
jgi:molybdate transport system substrate-binding protein